MFFDLYDNVISKQPSGVMKKKCCETFSKILEMGHLAELHLNKPSIALKLILYMGFSIILLKC